MGEVLKVCRLGPNWAVKDRTGAFWHETPKREGAERAAAAMAKRRGAQVVVRDEPGVRR
jgi:hypothetical protein